MHIIGELVGRGKVGEGCDLFAGIDTGGTVYGSASFDLFFLEAPHSANVVILLVAHGIQSLFATGVEGTDARVAGADDRHPFARHPND